MAVRIRRPETVKVDISDGDWLLLKKHLTAGEQRSMFNHMAQVVNGEEHFRKLEYVPALIATYLLDWSIQDPDGKPVVVADQPYEVIVSALDSLDPESFREIHAAVEKHQAATEKALAAEKNVLTGANAS